MNPDVLRVFWLGINLLGLAVTAAAVIDAWDNRRAIKALNGHARELASAGGVRREAFRVAVVLDMLLVLLPGVTIVALLAIPVLLLASSLYDARDRRRMTIITAAELVVERDSDIKRLLSAIAENTRISEQAASAADKAYHEANSVNEKIASQGAVLVAQGEDMAADRARTSDVVDTIDTTAAQVNDLHEGTAPS